MVGRQNADIADTLQLRDVAMATTFWLWMGYNFSSMTGSQLNLLNGTKNKKARMLAINMSITNLAVARLEQFRTTNSTTTNPERATNRCRVD